MKKQRTWDYSLAMAAAQDAANRQMRKAGRSAWSREDYNLACETVARLLGDCLRHRSTTPVAKAPSRCAGTKGLRLTIALALLALASCAHRPEQEKYVWSVARGLTDHGPLILVTPCAGSDKGGWSATLRDTLGNFYTLPGHEAMNVTEFFSVGDTIR